MGSQIILIFALYVAIGLFEAPFPAEQGQSWRGKLRNLLYGTVLFIGGLLFIGLVYALLPFPPRILPDRGIVFSLGMVLVYLVFSDLIFYWYHRAQHGIQLLWRIHELHHSDAELNVTTSMRTYWLDRPLQTLLITLPIGYLIGTDTLAAGLFSVIFLAWLCFSHANWRLQLGALTPFITGPQLHRLHHSILPQHQNKNFAQFFPVLDILFGTYYAPAPNEFPPTGTEALPSDAPFFTVMTRPFGQWSRGSSD